MVKQEYFLEKLPNGRYVWTDFHLNEIKRLYTEEQWNMTDIGRLFGLGYGTIKYKLKSMGIKIRNQKDRFPINSNYFESIDAPSKAYWLGFLYADGCVSQTRNSISIALKDKEHLQKFANAIESKNKIIESNSYKFNKKFYKMFHFSVRDHKMKQDLINLGCVPNKTKIISSIPKGVSKSLVSHFIRGYFDGDGSIHIQNQNGRLQPRLSFVGNKKMLEEIRDVLCLSMKIEDNNGLIPVLQILGRKQVLKVLDYMYKESTEETRLDRKYEKYLEFKKDYEVDFVDRRYK